MQMKVKSEKMMLAIDTMSAYLYPFVCDTKGQLNEIPLVSNPNSGDVALQKQSMKPTVTGGDAYSREPVALMVKV